MEREYITEHNPTMYSPLPYYNYCRYIDSVQYPNSFNNGYLSPFYIPHLIQGQIQYNQDNPVKYNEGINTTNQGINAFYDFIQSMDRPTCPLPIKEEINTLSKYYENYNSPDGNLRYAPYYNKNDNSDEEDIQHIKALLRLKIQPVQSYNNEEKNLFGDFENTNVDIMNMDDISTIEKIEPSWIYQDVFDYDTYENARNDCIKKSMELFNYILPLDIYYKTIYDNRFVKVGRIHSFIFNKNAQKVFDFNIEYGENIIKLCGSGLTLNKVATYLREEETGENKKSLGWRTLKYKTENGNFISLNNFFTTESKNGTSLPTSKCCIKYCLTKKKYLLFNVNKDIFPKVE